MRGRPGAGEQPGSARDNARVSGRGPLPSRMAFRLVVGLMLLLLLLLAHHNPTSKTNNFEYF